jgi:catechol 2,3-dioxygenase-like lactoylglutathione lyase family enzyme
MSTTPVTIPSPPEGQDLATVPLKFEVTPLPITDFDRAKAFYQRLGWRLDIDLEFAPGVRAVQFTPPGSPASIQFAPAGAAPLQRLLLIVEDIEAAHAELVDRGIDVSEIFHASPGQPPEPGRDPEGRSYVSQAAFTDPDGNQWVLQEVTERIPGRVEMPDSGPRAELLLETAKHHGAFEAVAPPHDWWDWYGAYMVARESGSTPDQADAAAGRYMAEVKNVVVPAT